jgi:hypothetical protein
MSKLERLKKDVADAEAALCRADVLGWSSSTMIDISVAYIDARDAKKALTEYLEEASE